MTRSSTVPLWWELKADSIPNGRISGTIKMRPASNMGRTWLHQLGHDLGLVVGENWFMYSMTLEFQTVVLRHWKLQSLRGKRRWKLQSIRGKHASQPMPSL
jgi:hypothetical protein